MKKNYFFTAYMAALLGVGSISAQNSAIPTHLAQPLEYSYQRAGGSSFCEYEQVSTGFANGWGSYMNTSNVPQHMVLDDIVIPANETWEISGFYSQFFTNSYIVANSVYVFADNGSSAPSTNALNSYIALTPVSADSVGTNFGYIMCRVYVNFPTPLVLSGGASGTRYWISSVARNTGNTTCYWESNNLTAANGTTTYYGTTTGGFTPNTDGNGRGAVMLLEYVKSVSVSHQICPGDSILIAGNYYSTSGVVNQTLAGLNCDSIVHHNINVKPYCVDSCNYFQENDPADMFVNGYQSYMNSGGVAQNLVADDIFVPANEKWAINGMYSFFFSNHGDSIIESKIFFFNDSTLMPQAEAFDTLVGLTTTMSDSMGTRYGFTIFAVYTPFNQPYIIDGGSTGKTLWISNVARSQNGGVCYWETGYNMLNGTPSFSRSGSGNTWTAGSSDAHRAIFELDYDLVIDIAPLANDTVCNTIPAFTLPTATPSGGVYSGVGVSGNSFNPATAGPGTHTIIYSYTHPTTGCDYSEVIDIVVENCTGLAENAKNSNVKVFPNPFSQSVNISNAQEIAQVEIRDITGRVVYTAAYNNVNVIQINTAAFTSGVYFIRMTTLNNEVIDQKIVK
jgi:hypothetical protein